MQCAVAARRFFIDLATINTSNPRKYSVRANARPIPLEPPMTTAKGFWEDGHDGGASSRVRDNAEEEEEDDDDSVNFTVEAGPAERMRPQV